MQHGYWIPISKAFKVDFPKDRAFSRIEAIYSLQLDCDKVKKVTITGYSKLWRWSKGKVIRFLESMNAGITYAEDTKLKQNQNGLIIDLITERKRTDNKHKRLINNSDLQKQSDIKRTDNGLITDRKQVTTREPKPKPRSLKPKKKVFSQNSDELRLSKLLFSLLVKINPKHKEPNLQKWAKQIDLAIRIDKRTPDDLEKVMRWALADSFWQSNIQSTDKLRKQFDQLTMKMNDEEYVLFPEKQESIEELCS